MTYQCYPADGPRFEDILNGREIFGFNETDVIHSIKTEEPFFRSLRLRTKNAELRKMDRDYRVGNILHLMQYDKDKDRYSGLFVHARITYITDYPVALKPEYGMLCLEFIRQGALILPGARPTVVVNNY